MKPGQPFADLPALAATDKESLSVQTKGKIGDSDHAPADHFRGVTKLIACGKRWATDHFRGATKMVVYGKVRQAVCTVGIRRFSTQSEENLNEVLA